MIPPTLSTSRLVLRPLLKATQRQVDWLRDPRVVEFSEQRHATHTLSSCLRYINSFNHGGSYLWAIWSLGHDAHIGNLTASIDEPNRFADMGIMIGMREAWGNGYGPEAWQVAADWLLHPEGAAIRKLEAGCMKPNEQMIKVLRKCRFQFEAERPAHFIFGGSPVGAVYYARYR